MPHLHEAHATTPQQTATVSDGGSAAVHLDAALFADQAEREQRRKKWARRKQFVRRWRELHHSRMMIRFTAGYVPAALFLVLVARLQPEADGSTKILSALGWFLVYTALRAGLGWILKRWELWIDDMVRREGIDLQLQAAGASG